MARQHKLRLKLSAIYTQNSINPAKIVSLVINQV